MLDIKYIRDNSEELKQNVLDRGLDPAVVDVDQLLKIDKKRSEFTAQVEGLRSGHNQLNGRVARTQDSKKRAKLIKQGKELKIEIKGLEQELEVIGREFQRLMSWMPNIVHPEMSVGKGEAENVELKVWVPEEGYLSDNKLGTHWKSAEFMPKAEEWMLHHVDLGKKLDLIDIEQSAEVSGSRFCYLKNEAALLQYALIDLLTKKLIEEGFVPMIPPVLVRERALFGTSHFPGGRDQVYKLESEYVEEKNELYLVGSSEPPLFAYWMDKVIEKEDLPVKMFALTTCFRSEVGSWGKDVRGIKRVHQFDKLEIDVVCAPDQSTEVTEYLLGINEWLLQSLELPYRIVRKCTGDAGYIATYDQYDVDAWVPSQQEYLELMTATNTWDFQARRLNIKYEGKGGEKALAHTVNDTGCAMGRMLIAILDNYQQKDGTVKVPEALQEYVGKKVIG